MESGLIIETGAFEAVVEVPTPKFVTWKSTDSKLAKMVKVELCYWQSPDGRVKRAYINGLGPRGGHYRLGYFDAKYGMHCMAEDCTWNAAQATMVQEAIDDMLGRNEPTEFEKGRALCAGVV